VLFWNVAVLGPLLMGTACQDLEVLNENEPDRIRALSDAGDVQALLKGTHERWFSAMTSGDAGSTIGVMGMEHTGVSGASTEVTEEPRRGFRTDDAPGGPARLMAILWRASHAMASNAYDYLRTAEELGFTFEEGGVDVTERNRAYAKLMQGYAWGYQAVIYDQGIPFSEDIDLQNDPTAQAQEVIAPWPEVLDKAIESIEAAIQIAQAAPNFTFPSNATDRGWFGTPQAMTKAKFIELANTLAARFLIESARNPADRAATDWNKVLAFTAAGLTSDFEIVLSPGVRSSNYLSRIQSDAAGCTNCQRPRYEVIGMADISGAYQDWLATPIVEKDRFDIVTPDRRITGETPQSPGAYYTWRASNNGFPSQLGHYRRSAYQWVRHLNGGFPTNSGNMRLASADENRLFRAEALIHLNRMAEAAELINVTRTRSHRLPDGVTYPGLPPVTAAGVPQSADCVPRTDQGACGDLLVALRYERMIELAGMGTIRGYSDARGFGMLTEGTAVQYPIIQSDLEAMGIPNYTFGGVGTEFGATYDPVTLANFK
jgi:hypothetical protein